MERTQKNVRLGLTLPLGSAASAVAQAQAARAEGFEEIWLAEVAGGDAYALAGALAVGAPGMPIGTAVVPAQTRTPMIHAMAAMTLSQLTEGNFMLGLGLSSPNIVRDWGGQPYDKPLTRMREQPRDRQCGWRLAAAANRQVARADHGHAGTLQPGHLARREQVL